MVIERALERSPRPTKGVPPAKTQTGKESMPPAKAQTGKEAAVSEWTSILNSLFRIEEAIESETDSTVTEDPQPQSGRIADATDMTILWTSLLPQSPTPYSPANPPGEAVKLWEAVGAESSLTMSTIETETEAREQPPEDSHLFELSGSEWSVLPDPILAPYQDKPEIIPPVQEASSEPLVPRDTSRNRPSQSKDSPQLPACSKEPASVEAVFRLQTPNVEEVGKGPAPSKIIDEDSTAPRPHPDGANSAAISEPRDIKLPELEPRQADGIPERRTNRNDSLPIASKAQGSQGDSSRNGRDTNDERRALEPSRELETLSQQAPLHLLNPLDGARKVTRETGILASANPMQEASQPATLILNPEKRISPLQLELRVSSEDFGIQSTKHGSEVRLQLLQRGDEVFMKIHGGDDRLAIRADTEWERLIERLKPHGLEPITRAIPNELARREGESSTAPITPQTAHDSTSDPKEEQRRFGNEQQQNQQRQQRQRSLETLRKNASEFSIERDLNSPQ